MKTADKAQKTENEARGRKGAGSETDQADWHWADPKSLKVKAEFQRLIPLQSREEYRALNESIQAEGCRDALLVWKGHNVVLDGHTRRDLCIEHGKKVKVREVELPDEKAAIEFILRLQRQRRNLTREAMSYFRGTEYNALKQLRGGNKRGRRPNGQNDRIASTAERLADQYGVAEKTIRRDGIFAQIIDKLVAEYGDPEVKRHLLGADVKLTQGLARLVLKKPLEERKAAVKQLVEHGRVAPSQEGGRLPLGQRRWLNPSSRASRQRERTTHDPFCIRWRVSWVWKVAEMDF